LAAAGVRSRRASTTSEAAAAARNAVLISIVADVARNYVDMRGLQMRLAILRDNIATAQQSRDFENARFDRGLTNELDFQLASRELATLQAELPPLQSEIQTAQYDIAVLLGQYPEDLTVELAKPGTLPILPESIEADYRSTYCSAVLMFVRQSDNWQRPRANWGCDRGFISARHAQRRSRHAIAGIGAQGSHIWAFGPSVLLAAAGFWNPRRTGQHCRSAGARTVL